MEEIILHENIGPLILVCLEFSELQRLCTVSSKLHFVKDAGVEYKKVAKYLHNRQLFQMMWANGSENEDRKKDYKDAINPNHIKFGSARIIIGIDPTVDAINVGNSLVDAWRQWLVLKHQEEGDHGMRFVEMSGERLSHHFGDNSFYDLMGESDDDDDQYEVHLRKRAKRNKIYTGYQCQAKYGCLNTLETHTTFVFREDFHICSQCMDSPGMELAKLSYMWENSRESEEWRFGEQHYFDNGVDLGRFVNEAEWWGLQDNEKWACMFKLETIMVPPNVAASYSEVRWIMEGGRYV
jgi:hypothetical protein